ncbi:MAG: biliverdin-producing heme oxygenase [Planctomycetaceae bacterium]
MVPTDMNLRETLRETTAATHKELDRSVGDLKPFSSTARYSIYLQSMLELYVTYATAFDHAAQLAGLPRHADVVIESLKSDLNTVEPSTNGTANRSATETTTAAAWGVGYTLEGSAMGASFMIRSAAEKLPNGTGLAFLERLSGDAKTRWPIFRDALVTADCDRAESVASAQGVFESAHQIFTRNIASADIKPMTQ